MFDYPEPGWLGQLLGKWLHAWWKRSLGMSRSAGVSRTLKATPEQRRALDKRNG